jgi:hypothetical protein
MLMIVACEGTWDHAWRASDPRAADAVIEADL